MTETIPLPPLYAFLAWIGKALPFLRLPVKFSFFLKKRLLKKCETEDKKNNIYKNFCYENHER